MVRQCVLTTQLRRTMPTRPPKQGQRRKTPMRRSLRPWRNTLLMSLDPCDQTAVTSSLEWKMCVQPTHFYADNQANTRQYGSTWYGMMWSPALRITDTHMPAIVIR